MWKSILKCCSARVKYTPREHSWMGRMYSVRLTPQESPRGQVPQLFSLMPSESSWQLRCVHVGLHFLISLVSPVLPSQPSLFIILILALHIALDVINLKDMLSINWQNKSTLKRRLSFKNSSCYVALKAKLKSLQRGTASCILSPVMLQKCSLISSWAYSGVPWILWGHGSCSGCKGGTSGWILQ